MSASADGTAALLHPAAIAAIVVLVVNDHVLKARWPGLVTGKLSDVAGMIFFPLVLFAMAAVIARASKRPELASRRVLVVCAIATGVAFAAVKTWAPATLAFEAALGALRWPFAAARALIDGAALPATQRAAVVRDVTDLVALPFVAIAIAIGTATRGSARARRVRDDRFDDARPHPRR